MTDELKMAAHVRRARIAHRNMLDARREQRLLVARREERQRQHHMAMARIEKPRARERVLVLEPHDDFFQMQQTRNRRIRRGRR